MLSGSSFFFAANGEVLAMPASSAVRTLSACLPPARGQMLKDGSLIEMCWPPASGEVLKDASLIETRWPPASGEVLATWAIFRFFNKILMNTLKESKRQCKNLFDDFIGRSCPCQKTRS